MAMHLARVSLMCKWRVSYTISFNEDQIVLISKWLIWNLLDGFSISDPLFLRHKARDTHICMREKSIWFCYVALKFKRSKCLASHYLHSQANTWVQSTHQSRQSFHSKVNGKTECSTSAYEKINWVCDLHINSSCLCPQAKGFQWHTMESGLDNKSYCLLWHCEQ